MEQKRMMDKVILLNDTGIHSYFRNHKELRNEVEYHVEEAYDTLLKLDDAKKRKTRNSGNNCNNNDRHLQSTAVENDNWNSRMLGRTKEFGPKISGLVSPILLEDLFNVHSTSTANTEDLASEVDDMLISVCSFGVAYNIGFVRMQYGQYGKAIDVLKTSSNNMSALLDSINDVKKALKDKKDKTKLKEMMLVRLVLPLKIKTLLLLGKVYVTYGLRLSKNPRTDSNVRQGFLYFNNALDMVAHDDIKVVNILMTDDDERNRTAFSKYSSTIEGHCVAVVAESLAECGHTNEAIEAYQEADRFLSSPQALTLDLILMGCIQFNAHTNSDLPMATNTLIAEAA